MSWCCTMLFAACRCGTNQTGGFVQGSSASDGLLGLGLADISVPSTMARQGVAQNSFSMCFALDGSGRIVFGDRGPPKQPSTPLVKISNLWAFPIPTTSLAPGYIPTCLHAYLPSFLTKLSVICLSVWGLHTYACLYNVIWLAKECRKTYIVTLQQIVVGGTIFVPANIQAIVDTGTSFTYFSTPVYTQFAEVVRIKRYFL